MTTGEMIIYGIIGVIVVILIARASYVLGCNKGYIEGREKACERWSRIVDRLLGKDFVEENRLVIGFMYRYDQDKKP